jgi:hypothetical protein
MESISGEEISRIPVKSDGDFFSISYLWSFGEIFRFDDFVSVLR